MCMCESAAAVLTLASALHVGSPWPASRPLLFSVVLLAWAAGDVEDFPVSFSLT